MLQQLSSGSIFSRILLPLAFLTFFFQFCSGVESFDIDMKEQKVTVKGTVQPEAVLQTVSKTGKKTSFWEEAAPAEPEAKPKEPELVA